MISILKGKSSLIEIQRGYGTVLHRTQEIEKHVKPKNNAINLTPVENLSRMPTREY
jgi:hypothetical protein